MDKATILFRGNCICCLAAARGDWGSRVSAPRSTDRSAALNVAVHIGRAVGMGFALADCIYGNTIAIAAAHFAFPAGSTRCWLVTVAHGHVGFLPSFWNATVVEEVVLIVSRDVGTFRSEIVLTA